MMCWTHSEKLSSCAVPGDKTSGTRRGSNASDEPIATNCEKDIPRLQGKRVASGTPGSNGKQSALRLFGYSRGGRRKGLVD